MESENLVRTSSMGVFGLSGQKPYRKVLFFDSPEQNLRVGVVFYSRVVLSSPGIRPRIEDFFTEIRFADAVRYVDESVFQAKNFPGEDRPRFALQNS